MITYQKLPEIIKRKNLPPKYIQLEYGSCLRYQEINNFAEPTIREYFRDAGCWSVGILKAIDENESWYVLDCSDVMDTPLSKYHLSSLFPCSKKEWMESNKGYI